MKYIRKWFTLIEVIVATSILTLTVFWVYKLIWENNKLLSQSHNIQNSHYLYYPFVECLSNIWLSALKSESDEIFIWFWLNNLDCVIVWSDTYVEIDKIQYKLRAYTNDQWDGYINWLLEIESDEWKKITNNFLQK